VLKKQDFEPFAVAFFGWRALAILRLPYNKFEGTHLHICRIGLDIYNDELDALLRSLADRPTTMTNFVEATEAEKDAVQKFVVRKYGAKYMPGLNAISAADGKTAPPKMDEGKAWKYSLGAALGELAGSVTKWFAFPNNPKYDQSISQMLGNLQKEIKAAPKDAPPDLLANLNRLSAFAGKTFFAPDERQQIGAAIKQTLLSTMAFAKPLPKTLETFVDEMEKAKPAPTNPAATTASDPARAKEVANQYRLEGLKKFQNKLYDPAIEDFNRAAELDPANQSIYSNRGQAYLEKGEADKAILDFTRAINIGGITADDHYYLNDRARAYFKKGQMELALADLNLAISLFAKNAYGYYLRGFIYKTQGKAAEARSDFQAALRINPDFQAAKDELAKLGR
jgi:predicted negative regulator of RcsB-dependent stress response